MTENVAIHQDIRPLRLLILNLMPTKVDTEVQLLRKLSNSPLQVEVEFIRMVSHSAKNMDASYLETFYRTFSEVKNRRFDGMIITGAPVETLEFESVDYWPELCEIFRWTTKNVHSTFHICWGAQAALYYYYGVPKHNLPKKCSGVFEHEILKTHSPLFFGFDDVFNMPHSRFTAVAKKDLLKVPELELMAESGQAGVSVLKSDDNKRFFVLGHAEYDADTLSKEYFRDVNAGLNPDVPQNYFPHDDPALPPRVSWRAYAQLMFSNWLNYYVYQSTPYNIDQIGVENCTDAFDSAML
jgi:homoserine O-succinyltransferase